MRCAVIIVAGGAGKRFGAKVPKQFLPLAGKALYRWSIEAFRAVREVRQIVLVVPPERIEAMSSAAARGGFELAPGGRERIDSVRNGLGALRGDIDFVAIHDAARPLITPGVIRRSLAAVKKSGAALVAVPSRDTVKIGDGKRARRTVPRETVFLAQTPQVFRRSLIEKVYRARAKTSMTDDAQAAERAGYRVALVPGDYANIKITGPEDMAVAAALLKAKRGKQVF